MMAYGRKKRAIIMPDCLHVLAFWNLKWRGAIERY
jgi:regulator of extracellular matrix RemA (YlzA/DUF370 family)